MPRPFHIAFPVTDLQQAREFYTGVLGCTEGRSSEQWVDFNLYGHQIVAHRVTQMPSHSHNPVDGKSVPVPHMGVVLTLSDWKALRDKLIAQNITFIIEPYIRFEGKAGEQATMFFMDPFNNALEFKAIALEALFAK